MRQEITTGSDGLGSRNVSITWVHTLIIGSGAAGLNTAIQLYQNGVKDLLIVTEGLQMGTSINTGSDKQTYYKLAICENELDSPYLMASALFAAGSMHGDLALIEASESTRAFINLVNLGIPFPRDRFGQYIGYKTDHDPKRRATSVGPYTSREMCISLIHRATSLGIPIREHLNVIQLLTMVENGQKRALGAIAINAENEFEIFIGENTVFAVGGPAGMYTVRAYPKDQVGAIGVALLAGAKAQSLPESQFGIASLPFPWCLSGSYMQVIPTFISRPSSGSGDDEEFLLKYFDNPGEMNSAIFRKGYQWPFDAKQVLGGSSFLDLLVNYETTFRKRRVFMDYRRNSQGFSLDALDAEARSYLEKSDALRATPYDRLHHINPLSISVFRENGVDLAEEMLEIGICAQHNNGGLAANHWWESENIMHLFPVGEVNGTHGVARPGGAALNSGQVGGFRIAEYIAHAYTGWSIKDDIARQQALSELDRLKDWLESCTSSQENWRFTLQELQSRMTQTGTIIRDETALTQAVAQASEQWTRIRDKGCNFQSKTEVDDVFRTRQLCFAQLVYLTSILHAVRSGVGSRGSSIQVGQEGIDLHPGLREAWKVVQENQEFQDFVLETNIDSNQYIQCEWVARRPIPETESWFERDWPRFQSGAIFEPWDPNVR